MEITASNAIFLGEETGGKGRQFKARFLVPGLVKYDYGVCLLTKENADKFIKGFTGCPVVINHQDVTDENVKEVGAGDIFSVWFDEKDGYYWCNGIIRDKKAIELINQGYSVSCQYVITEYSDNTEGKLHNGNPYDKVIENGRPEHLAIVNNPRYEGAIIAVNALNTQVLDDVKGEMYNAQNAIPTLIADTISDTLAEGIIESLLGCSHLTSPTISLLKSLELSARNPLGELLASNEDKWITMKKNGKTWKVKIEEKPENFNADKKLAAWAILSAGTGKKISWLKMNLKRSEKLQELIKEPGDKLQTSGIIEEKFFTNYYPDLHKINYDNDSDSNGAESAAILEQVYDDLLNDNFYGNSDDSDSEDTAKDMIKSEIDRAKKSIKSSYVKDILKHTDKITEKTFESYWTNFEKYPEDAQTQIINDYEVLSDIYDLQKMLGEDYDK